MQTTHTTELLNYGCYEIVTAVFFILYNHSSLCYTALNSHSGLGSQHKKHKILSKEQESEGADNNKEDFRGERERGQLSSVFHILAESSSAPLRSDEFQGAAV